MSDAATPDAPVKPWVTMAYPGIEGTGISTREAVDVLWSEKGWTIVDQHDEAPGLEGDDVQPERIVSPDGLTITDELADPTRLTKVLAGEVKAADVGVDPALEPGSNTVEVEPAAAPPTQLSTLIPRIEGETFADYQARATTAGIRPRDQLSEESWNAVTAVPAGQGA